MAGVGTMQRVKMGRRPARLAGMAVAACGLASAAPALSQDGAIAVPGPWTGHVDVERDAFPPLMAAAYGIDDAELSLTSQPDSGPWRRGSGQFEHLASGVTCGFILRAPETGDRVLVLEGIKLFNPSGNDSACHYRGQTDPIRVSLFVTKSPMALEAHAEGALKDMHAFLHELRPVPAGATVALPEALINAPDAVIIDVFEGPTGDAQTLGTALWLTKAGDWHIKVRATYAPPSAWAQNFGQSLFGSAYTEAAAMLSADPAQRGTLAAASAR